MRPDTGIDLEAKACVEAFQTTQKRARAALFLSILASCIVMLMVFNLVESHQLRRTDLITHDSSGSEYLREHSKQIADLSYYQLPLLGIQVTCDDVGLWGPVALFVFTIYSAMAFKASYCHINCLTSAPFAGTRLVRTLIEAEQIPGFSDERAWPLIPAILMFLPSLACFAVLAYDVYAHVLSPSRADPLYEIMSKMRGPAIFLDGVGAIAALSVFVHNYRTFQFLRRSQTRLHRCLRSEPTP